MEDIIANIFTDLLPSSVMGKLTQIETGLPDLIVHVGEKPIAFFKLFQSLLSRDGRSLIVASLDHNQMSELYVVRRELEGLAASLAAQHATAEEVRILRDMVEQDHALVNDPPKLAIANRRFHKQIHLASHNRHLVQQLDLVHRTMALMSTTSLAAEGRTKIAQGEHDAIVTAIEAKDSVASGQALRDHISVAFMTRLKQDAEARKEKM